MKLSLTLFLSASIAGVCRGSVSIRREFFERTYKTFSPAVDTQVKSYPTVSDTDTATLENVGRALACSTLVNQIDDCADFKSIDGMAMYRVDEAAQKLYVGFRFFLNVPKAEDYGNQILQDADELFTKLSDIYTQYKTFEIFLVGMGSGGSVAVIHGSRLCSFNAGSGVLFNADNRVKVITVKELPILLARLNPYPVGKDNHIAIMDKDHLAKFKAPVAFFGQEIKIEKVPNASVDLLAPEATVPYMSRPIRGNGLDGLEREVVHKLTRLVTTSVSVTREIGKQLPHIIRGTNSGLLEDHFNRSMELVMSGVNGIVAGTNHKVQCVRRPISKDGNPRIYTISCEVSMMEGKKEAKKMKLGSFTIQLTTYAQKDNACAALPVQAPSEQRDFVACLTEIAKHSHKLDFLLPNAQNSCRFESLFLDANSFLAGEGHIVRPDATNFDHLAALHNRFPEFFFSIIKTNQPFVKQCDVIKPVGSNVLDAAFKEFTTLIDRPVVVLQKARATITTQENTVFSKENREGFSVLGVSQSMPFYSDPRLDKNIQRCLLNSPVVYDCTQEMNQWLPQVCPRMCKNDLKAPADIAICKNIAYCPESKVYVGAARNPTTMGWRSLSLELESWAKESKASQYLIYKFQPDAFFGITPNKFFSSIIKKMSAEHYAMLVWDEVPAYFRRDNSPDQEGKSD